LFELFGTDGFSGHNVEDRPGSRRPTTTVAATVGRYS
jgi:hypothetical protein